MNQKLASFHLGFPFDSQEAINIMGDRIQVIDGGRKWHLRKFVKFQYPGGLCSKSAPHRQVLRLLQAHGIDSTESLKSSLHETSSRVGTTLKDIDKDKDKEEDKDKDSPDLVDRDAIPMGHGQPTPTKKPKLGILELRMIPGLKLLPKDIEKLLVVLNEVGSKTMAAAARECIELGQEAFESNVTAIAYQMFKATKNQKAENINPVLENITQIIRKHGWEACRDASRLKNVKRESDMLNAMISNPEIIRLITESLGAA